MPEVPDLTQPAGWLPLAFLFIMGLAILIYVVLDGYDLGVGILLHRADEAHRDPMVAAIGPFWDANETWLVLGVGVLLTAFPKAHGVILGALYLPVVAMLVGLILRGVAFDFRVKAQAHHRPLWELAFGFGSLVAALAQGYMLGMLVTGFSASGGSRLFAAGIGLGLAAGYCLLGAAWLLIKSEGPLQLRAVRWARISLWLTALAIAAVSVATPLMNPGIYARWFSVPNVFLLAPIPIATAVLFLMSEWVLRHLPAQFAAGNQGWCWVPFALAVAIFILAFHGLAYSLYPWLVPERLTIWQSATSPGAMAFILVGVLIVLPLILGWTAYSYRVFWGKARDLEY